MNEVHCYKWFEQFKEGRILVSKDHRPCPESSAVVHINQYLITDEEMGIT